MRKLINLLIVDDEREVGHFLRHLFEAKGYSCSVANDITGFMYCLQNQTFHIALVDLKLPDANGLDLLKKIKEVNPLCKVIIMTGYSTIQTAVDAIKFGASDYLEKPFDDIEALEQLIDQHLSDQSKEDDEEILQAAHKAGLVIGQSKKMKDILTMANKVAKKNINVLIQGETGTGKEVMSRFIHMASPRNKEAFVGVNCGALSESLLESELFGHEKGAFTGAAHKRKGLFEITTNGTLFLDEIVEASHTIQVKLLRVLESREFMRVGSESVIRTNARIVAATNENLVEAVKDKKFRQDLLYRINVVTLELPPLRERIEDIPCLVSNFLEKQVDKSIMFSDEAMEYLQSYSWPGNLRELYNILTRTVVLCDSKQKIIFPSDIPLPLHTANIDIMSVKKEENEQPFPNGRQATSVDELLGEFLEKIIQAQKGEDGFDLGEILEKVKSLESEVGQAFIKEKLRETLGNRKEAAKRLNITSRKLRYLLNEKNSPKEL